MMATSVSLHLCCYDPEVYVSYHILLLQLQIPSYENYAAKCRILILLLIYPFEFDVLYIVSTIVWVILPPLEI